MSFKKKTIIVLSILLGIYILFQVTDYAVIISIILGAIAAEFLKNPSKSKRKSSSKSEEKRIKGAKMVGSNTVVVSTTKGTFNINPVIGIENWTNDSIVVRRKTSGSRDAIDTYNAKGSRIDSYLEQ
jgi:hypothetical protein